MPEANRCVFASNHASRVRIAVARPIRVEPGRLGGAAAKALTAWVEQAVLST